MNNLDIKKIIKASINDHKESFSYVLTEEFEKNLKESITMTLESINKGGCIYSCGNGGSFSDAQHFTAELIVRYKGIDTLFHQ